MIYPKSGPVFDTALFSTNRLSWMILIEGLVVTLELEELRETPGLSQQSVHGQYRTNDPHSKFNFKIDEVTSILNVGTPEQSTLLGALGKWYFSLSVEGLVALMTFFYWNELIRIVP
jgi:hypothetical protein